MTTTVITVTRLKTLLKRPAASVRPAAGERPATGNAPAPKPRTKRQPAVATHRLFPVACALWCAALFGLGTLVASAVALASFVRHLHLPAIVPAAAPPLGMTARLLLAVALAMLGAGLGFVVGRVLHDRAKRAQPPRAAAVPPVKPAQAYDKAVRADADQPDLGGPDASPVASPLERIQRVRSRDAHPDAPPRRPLVVTEDVLPWPSMVADHDPVPASREPVVSKTDGPKADEPGGGDPESGVHDLPPFLAAAYAAVQKDDVPAIVAPVAPVSAPLVVEPALPEAPVPDPVAIEPAKIAPAAPLIPPPLASQAAAAPKVALDRLPLGELGLVQMIERLALAIAVRQDIQAANAADWRDGEPVQPTEFAPHTADFADPRTPLHRFDPLTMDPTGPLLRAKPQRADHHDLDESEADTPHVAAAVHDADPVDTGEGHDGPIAEQRYSSLAAMAMPRPELVAFDATGAAAPEHDPVVPFPTRLSGGDAGSPPLAAPDADRALREALATLRQMSAQR